MGTSLTIRAEDNPAQAKAREALVSKLFEISAQEPVTNPPPATTKAKVEKAAPVVKAPVVKAADEPVMVPVGGDAKAQAKAAKAAKEAELKAQKEAAKQAAAQKEADEIAAKAKAKADAAQAAADLKAQKLAAKKAADQKAAEVAAAKKQVKANLESPKPVVEAKPTTIIPQPGDTPAQAKAREALAKSLFDEAAAKPVDATAPAATLPPDSLATSPERLNLKKPEPAPEPAVAAAPAPKTVIAPAPIGMAPPLPISMDKQQKLQELLTKYRADQVTPEEYQKQRAAILAEP